MDPHFLALMSMKVTAIFDLNTKFKGTYRSSELTNHILSNLLSIKISCGAVYHCYMRELLICNLKYDLHKCVCPRFNGVIYVPTVRKYESMHKGTYDVNTVRTCV